MIKRRNRKVWKTDKIKLYLTFQKNFTGFLILGLLFTSNLTLLKKNSQLIYSKLPKNPLFLNTMNDKTIQPKLGKGDDIQNKQFRISGSANMFKNVNLTNIDNYAFSIHYDGASVSDLASILSHYAKTEAEKARIIYSWIAHNISYDVQAYLSKDYRDSSPQAVLITRKGVCSGYANLYMALARAMGLESSVIDGYAKGYGYVVSQTTKINHAWNAVKINNKWYLIDSTWGAGNINSGKFNKQFNPYYFAAPPEQFIFDHFPVENQWQLLTKNYTKEQFDAAPKIFPEFFRDGLRFVSYYNHTIQADGRFQIVLSAPKDTIAIARLKTDSNYLNDNYTLVQKKGDKIIVIAAPPIGNSELEIFSKNKYASGLYRQALTYKVVSVNAGEEFPKTYSTFSEKNSYLHTPFDRYLPTNQLVNFEIEVPDALEVQVIDAPLHKWVKLTRSGNIFTGYVPVSADKIQVSAKFSGNKDYWTLVEYN